MKKVGYLSLMFLWALPLFGQSPFTINRSIQKMPNEYKKPSRIEGLNRVEGRSDIPWVVYSDRVGNVTYTSPGGAVMMKELAFMEPFYVADEKDGYLKLIKYKEGMLRGGKILDVKAAQSCGWIPRSKLLLWQSAFINPRNGYAEKAITIINGKLPLLTPAIYFDKSDSVYVYESPAMTTKIGKVKLGQLVYAYKKSEDGKKVLIGNEEQLLVNRTNSIYGWVTADVLHHWGERLYISLIRGTLDFSIRKVMNGALQSVVNDEPFIIDTLLDSSDMIARSFPVLQTKNGESKIAIARNLYNKTQNTVTTINGASLTYKRYLSLHKGLRKVNIVLVIDGGSSMSGYSAGLINTIQSLEAVFNQHNQQRQFRYGAIVYRNATACKSNRTIQSFLLNKDFREMIRFLHEEARQTALCGNSTVPQPVGDALEAASEILKEGSDETNLIVLMGSTGDQTLGEARLNGLSNKLAARDVNLLAIQVFSRRGDLFNDFIVQTRKLVSKSAKEVARSKRSTMVNGESLAVSQDFNVSLNDSTSFYLDYPKKSIVTGGVIFPALGDVKSSQEILVAVRRFIRDNNSDIDVRLNSLDSIFRITGLSRDKLNPAVEHRLDRPVGEQVANQMPHNLFKFYTEEAINPNLVQENPALFEYILILNSTEYHRLIDILSLMKGENIQKDAPNFRSQLYKNYLDIATKRFEVPLNKKIVERMNLNEYFRQIIGLPLANGSMMQFTVADLKSTNKMGNQDFEHYLNYLIKSIDLVKERTEQDQQFMSNGKVYHYFSQSDFD